MFFILLLAILLLDQITKYLAYVYLQPQNTIPVINNFFYLTYLESKGAVSGILRDKPWFIIAITAIIIIATLIYVYSRPGVGGAVKLGTVLMAAGISGNLVDSIRLGFVIGFLDFEIWPIFNIADISAVLGAAILIFVMFFNKDNRPA